MKAPRCPLTKASKPLRAHKTRALQLVREWLMYEAQMARVTINDVPMVPEDVPVMLTLVDAIDCELRLRDPRRKPRVP